MNITLNLNLPPAVQDELALIRAALQKLTTITETQGATIMKELDDLTAQAKANADVEESAVQVINGLAAKITAAGTDPAKLQALTTELQASASDLGAAIANTQGSASSTTGTTGASGTTSGADTSNSGGAPPAGGAPNV